ncbi:molybdenum cofactor biosynthesis protein MoaE [Candidatus Nitrosocosmicus agrestis]|jgi:molybdopterin synthase catalytic subunit|uniref:molybdenum cofactor biosynthesis protein MoaE n=1 Tax=Candidatus Nitrosocosmicus agrestis TaxID=2563600 RepID=UPI00122E6FE1|nr:molybdenum cofactor biosynthesis protein MoaE [Candidatus Nitrosocosmicus sp. SS]KAA2281101.1 molybdenum cofactor biosynthesis protein MoaE [Candidatus Nitrosocosmicus sp. SS]KAF0869401.1 molybdenum cofactor biosynthesis protein MoaE [Candidatus Nitrosocosmicus sp. SS]
MMHIITSEIDVNQILNSMTDKNGQSGATVVFTGSVRNSGKRGPVTEMYYEAYTEMAEKTLKKIEDMAMKEWGINRIQIVHRIGRLHLGDISVVIAISSPHSKEAFEICEKILAMIKQSVPIWKKELLSNGIEQWVDGKVINANNGSG